MAWVAFWLPAVKYFIGHTLPELLSFKNWKYMLTFRVTKKMNAHYAQE
jgi:hypothetical protein